MHGTNRQTTEAQRGGMIVAFSRDCRRALSGGVDGTVYLWETETGKRLHRFEGHRASVWSVAFSADGRYAVSCEKDGTIWLLRLPDPPSVNKP